MGLHLEVMLENFAIIHNLKSAGRGLPLVDQDPNWISWNTCLRHLSLGFLDPHREIKIISPDYKLFVGLEAYEFLLEIVCGLHSPIVGETEVMGQFKELVELNHMRSTGSFKKLFMQTLADAKIIRQSVLKNVGSRSYGSLLRKYLKNSPHVTVFGSGKLAQEILPWLSSTPKVNVVCRNEDRGHKLGQEFPYAEINSLETKNFGESLILAASISTLEVSKLLRDIKGIKNIIDLREESSSDPLNLEIPTLTLEELFSEIKTVEKDVLNKVSKAKSLITFLGQKLFHSAELRPFGWEDLCG